MCPLPSPLPPILITTPSHAFLATLSPLAPLTVSTFLSLLPYTQKVIHVRWSGEGLWIPLGTSNALFASLPYENNTAYPAPGEVLLYPGGVSETEFIVAYGSCQFASKMGVLAGNHFLTITEGLEELRMLGESVLWEGAKEVRFEVASEEM
ncbi:uncharacterized protein RAG0_15619 [Rhynchosporium agropyri]|uniref:Uncharacterized protein n=2 Tax=Rhynchosporium TaxID=38037 RepID=A0A1E1LZV8_RHYSE|nr:uncharacterized protein RAG0_15619 [Rhynchosporium agropyri]CZT42369.1 uncharacterized protein RSE6_02239 [Rhynchosporium secalis]